MIPQPLNTSHVSHLIGDKIFRDLPRLFSSDLLSPSPSANMISPYICFSFGSSLLSIVQASSHRSRGLSSFLLVTLTPEIETTGCKVELLVAIEIVSFLSVAAAEVDGDGEVVDVFFLSEARRPLRRDLKPIAAESCVDLAPFSVPESLYSVPWMDHGCPTFWNRHYFIPPNQTASTSAFLSWCTPSLTVVGYEAAETCSMSLSSLSL